MKLVHKDEQHVVFQLEPREKKALLTILKLYPVLPADFQALTKADDPEGRKVDQELLEQSLAEHKASNQQLLQNLFANPQRLVKSKSGWRLTLDTGDVEWFLQVLNDVRVGKWYLAGCPDEQSGKPLTLSVDNLKHYWAMEVAGAFQWQLLEALEGLGY